MHTVFNVQHSIGGKVTRGIILVFMLVFFGLEVVAQKSATLSFYVMPQRTMFLNRDESLHKGIVKNIPTYAYLYGVMLSQNFNSWIGLEYGFCGSRVEQDFEVYAYDGDPLPGISNKKSVLYLNIPLLLRTELIARPKNTLFVSVGPQVSILASEDGIIPIYYNHGKIGIPQDTVYAFDIAEASGAYRKLVLAAAGSLGWNTKIYKNIFLQLLIKADYTLTDIENKSFDTLYLDGTYKEVYLMYNKNRPATHIFTIGVGVGLGLKIR
jgi:hypothetical protein